MSVWRKKILQKNKERHLSSFSSVLGLSQKGMIAFMKRYIALSIAVFVLLIVLLSCGDKTTENLADDENPLNTAAESGIEPEIVSGDETKRFMRIDPELPMEDFGGYEFNILHWYVAGWGIDDCDDIVVEELNGDVFNDAVFNRDKTIEDKYNIEIKLIRMDVTEMHNTVRKTISAGDDVYDLIYQRLHDVMPLVSGGMFYDLNNIPNVNFDMPWWDKRSVDELSLGKKVYIAVSDISTSSQKAIGCILFNKKLAQDYAFENLYDVVERGDWTFDYMTEICKNIAKDLNGDGILDNNDFIPFVSGDFLTTMLFNGSGGKFSGKDENDMPVYIFNTERNINICNKILDFMYNPQLCLNGDAINFGGNTHTEMFKNNQGIFTMAQMQYVRDFRELEVDFGILPAPKYDKNQKEYFSTLSVHQSGLVAVPITARNTERTGIVLEALSAESRYTVQPAYYDISLKGKYVRDDESADMLDVLFNSRLYDLAELGHFGLFEMEWLRMVSNGNRDIVSLYEKYAPRIQSDIDKLITALEKLD